MYRKKVNIQFAELCTRVYSESGSRRNSTLLLLDDVFSTVSWKYLKIV